MPGKNNNSKKVSNTTKQEVLKFTDADKKRIKEDLIVEIEADIKDDLVKKVSDDVFSLYTLSEKDRIKNELTNEIKEDVKKRVVKEEALLSRRKSLKIFRMSIYIIVLLAAVGYGIYRLYKTDNLILLNKDYVPTKETTTNKTEETTSVKTKTFNELKEQYSYLMERIYVSDINVLLDSKTVAELDPSQKLNIAYHALNASDITHDGKFYSVSNETLQNAFENLFGTNAQYVVTDFVANGINYTYLNRQDSYIAISETADNIKYIQSEIVDIKEEDETITIKEVVGYVKDGNLYAINNLDTPIVTGYSSSVLDYKDSLTTVEYTFNKVNGSYKLFKISAK